MCITRILEQHSYRCSGQKISENLGLNFNIYQEHENFFLDAAREANLNGWELDRLMYNFTDDFLREIEKP